VVLILLLAALAVAGLFLAARAAATLPEAAGYALFLVSLALIFANLKHYFDRREHDRR
jgi:phosphotransferase system  glucose/maltose/N-acetylglucosamine-specific IIC component